MFVICSVVYSLGWMHVPTPGSSGAINHRERLEREATCDSQDVADGIKRFLCFDHNRNAFVLVGVSISRDERHGLATC